MSTTEHSYRAAGVDIESADRAVDLIKSHARTTFNDRSLSDIGAFSGLYQLGKYRDPVLVSSTDGVGTKVRIASLMDRYDTVGIDLVNHCINDALVCGARPLFFLDYLAMGKVEPSRAGDLAKGLASACRDADCVLIGGETAEMPGIYSGDDFDLAGFIVSVVERDELIDGSSIRSGDTIVGLPSNGLHTNGFSLVRRVFGIDGNPAVLDTHFPDLGRTLGDELLRPHLSYLPHLEGWLGPVKGLAHITGGGLPGNVPRILPDGLAARFDVSAWETPAVFELVHDKGGIPMDEMYRVFNMGIGMVIVCSSTDADDLVKGISGALVIGEIVEQQEERRVLL